MPQQAACHHQEFDCGNGGAVARRMRRRRQWREHARRNAPPTGSPSPTPAATPTPTPAPTPTAADSAEFKASAAVVSAKAAYAYDRGITGKGVTIAVIDSGIARSSPEFVGRISVDSTGFEQRIARCATCPGETVPHFAIDDNDGHGSKVASIAAAARNGSGMQGLAPDATILALKVTGPDLDGVTAGSTTPIREGTQPNAGLIAPALREAVAKGAFVTMMSLNGFGGGQVATEQRAAMDGLRAADRLLVEPVANETGKDSFAGQFAETLVGSDRANADWFLFAIGMDANGNPRSANGNAGVLADRMLAAVGVNVQVVDKDGSITTATGNSFAAPAVGGAAALLKQYWPQLGGKAIARILLDTATDMGAPGVDPIYGAGLLNVEKAMQAQAPASSFAAASAHVGGVCPAQAHAAPHLSKMRPRPRPRRRCALVAVSSARLGRHARIGGATTMLLGMPGGGTHPASPCSDRPGPAHRRCSALSGRRDMEEACLALPVVIEQANV
ncbi:S8 family serine peptidase [Sphingomonas parapaucimobilis]|uniref:S8 family serine peptidase n=1 Tax=Sphingomonas parapaucimobilis TaxID=28213 RepID=UPI0039E85FA6